MSAGTDMNQKIISMNLDMMEEQRHHMHSVLDQYVDQVITAGRQWTKSVERNKSSFVKIHKIITKAMEFLSLKCDEMEGEQVLRDSYVDNTGDFPVAKPVTTHKESTEDDSHDVRNPHTNLESDQQARYEDVYKQLQNILAKQDGLDQQVNMKFNHLREEMESLKLNLDQINTDLTAKVDEVSTDFSAKVDKINTDLSHKVDEIKTGLLDKADRINIDDLSDKIDDINTELTKKVDTIDLTAKVNQINNKFSDKVDKIVADLTDKINENNTELSEKIDEINTDLSDKVGEFNTEMSEKVGQIDTDLSKNTDQIGVVLETLSNSEQEHAAQINKIVDLENHVNTVEKDMQNNVRQVEQQLEEVGTNYSMIRELFITRLAPLEKLRDILNERATSQSENVRQLQAVMAELKDLSDVVETCARKSEAEVVGFHAETMFIMNQVKLRCVHPFQSPRLISGCQFDSTTGKFTAVVGGFYLVYIRLCIKHGSDGGGATIYLIHGPKSEKLSGQICLAKAEIREAPVFNIGIVEMKVNDELYILINGQSLLSTFRLNCAIQFSCLRFG